jgi:hypothetical protein
VTVVATGFDRMQQIRSIDMASQLSPRERQLNVPPPPPPTASALRVTAPLDLTGVRDVQIYATAGRGDMMHAANAAPPPVPVSMPMSAARRQGNDGLPIDLDEPAYTRRTPSYGTSHAQVQQALNPNPLAKREPIVGNPFANDDGTEMDRPAFMRK